MYIHQSMCTLNVCIQRDINDCSVPFHIYRWNVFLDIRTTLSKREDGNIFKKIISNSYMDLLVDLDYRQMLVIHKYSRLLQKQGK